MQAGKATGNNQYSVWITLNEFYTFNLSVTELIINTWYVVFLEKNWKCWEESNR